jgi:predicted amidohydrolase YtcJ
VTHEYTILTGGRVLGRPDDLEPATAIAWAVDTVLAVGGDEEVLSISRGDSRVLALHGALVAPGPGLGSLEPGSRADFSIRDAATGLVTAEVRAGRLVAGVLDARARA